MNRFIGKATLVIALTGFTLTASASDWGVSSWGDKASPSSSKATASGFGSTGDSWSMKLGDSDTSSAQKKTWIGSAQWKSAADRPKGQKNGWGSEAARDWGNGLWGSADRSIGGSAGRDIENGIRSGEWDFSRTKDRTKKTGKDYIKDGFGDVLDDVFKR